MDYVPNDEQKQLLFKKGRAEEITQLNSSNKNILGSENYQCSNMWFLKNDLTNPWTNFSLFFREFEDNFCKNNILNIDSRTSKVKTLSSLL